jgi:E1A/CREB-binding protein
MMNNTNDNSRMSSAGSSSQNMNNSHGGSFSSSNLANSFSQPQALNIPMPPPINGSVPAQGMQYPAMQSPSQQPYSSSGISNSSAGASAQPSFEKASRENSIMVGGNDLSTSNRKSSSGGQISGGSNQSTSARRNDSEWQKVRHKQQRLLLLRHASRCQYTSDCPVTPHCASMKKLWEHIAHCKNQQCDVAHCMSSRYVLSHYRRCKDARCPACAPVRETIRKSHEKERQGQSTNDLNSFDIEKQSKLVSNSFDPTPIGADDANTSPDYARSTKRTKTSDGQPGSSMGRLLSSPTEDIPLTTATHSSTFSQDKSTQPQTSHQTASSKAKASEDRSLLDSFSVLQLTTHLESLNRAAQLPPAKLKLKCSEVLKGLQTHQHGWVFNSPVDPVELGLPDYYEVIKKPMDLGTIHKKIDNGAYHAISDFRADTNLTFDNAMTYNEEGTVVYDMAKELKVKLEADYEKMVEQLEAEDHERRQNDRACVLCGCEKRLFEPPVFFCNGMNCQSKRIRRNSHFYVGGSSQYFWCNQCYNDLDEKAPIEFIDLSVKKSELQKRKNDEVHEESWVQCDVCERWIHQICGLFNTRQNKEHHSEYCCPLCLIEKRKKEQESIPPPKPPGAADLPRTKLSEFLENQVTKRIEVKKRKMAEEKCKSGVSSIVSLCCIPRVSLTLFSFAGYFHGGCDETGLRRWSCDNPSSHINGQKTRSPRKDEEKIRA